MTVSPRTPGLVETTVRRLSSSRLALLIAFIVVHVWLSLLNFYGPGRPLNDVSVVYRDWMVDLFSRRGVVGIDEPWVYPIAALLPMALAFVFGAKAYAVTWLVMVTVLDGIAIGVLTNWGRNRRMPIAWWWLGFLLLLGPIALGRIDSVTVPIAMVGAIYALARPPLASVLLTIAAWMKVWPVAVVGALLLAGRRRWRVFTTALMTSAVIVGIALIVGSGWNVFSFLGLQTGRGLQVEAPVSTIWLWLEKLGHPGIWVYFDQDLLTNQIGGPGTAEMSELMTPILVLGVAAIALLGFLARRRGVAATVLVPPLALAFVTALIAFNKVGSPQYVTWLAVPIVLGLVIGRRRWFLAPALGVMVIALLTQLIYPLFYSELLQLQLGMLIVITVRNLLFFALLGWAVWQIATVERRSTRIADVARYPVVHEL